MPDESQDVSFNPRAAEEQALKDERDKYAVQQLDEPTQQALRSQAIASALST